MTRISTDLTLDVDQQCRRAIDAFVSRFGRPPRYGAVAPGRVNLIGEHTDYNEGFVLPMAIDRQTVIVADLAHQTQSTLWAIDLDETTMIDLREQLSPVRGLAANYLLGVAQQFIETGELVPNLDVAVTSTVPIGAGLSSSAALEVAFATLLEQALETPLEPVQKALLCQRAEHAFPGAPVGIMDMLVSIQAEAGAALLIDCRSNQSQPVPLPPSEQASVLIVDTRRKHSLASGEYGLRRAACERAAKKLGVRALRDATLQMLQDSKLTGEERRRALHVVAENTRTILAAQALASRDLPAFGGLMFASHESLRDLFEVSCEELDVLVESAAELRDQGVFGARMTGGGFGGCIVALCETGSVDQIAHALSERFRERFDSECTPMIVRAAPGARILDLP